MEYAFALGYYDARATGIENNLFSSDDPRRAAYSEGYERGITDYCFEHHSEE